MALQQVSSVINIPAAEERQQPFRFLDLPPEIRNLIYDELLPLGQTVPIYGYSRYHVKAEFSCDTFTRLVTTNKQIHNEAVAKLYGDLTYSFEYGYAFTEWLQVIGTMKRHLRHIRLALWMLRQCRAELMRSALEQLKQAKELRVFELRIEYAFERWVKFHPAESVAADFEPFVRAMIEANRGHNSRKKALRIFCVSGNAVWMEGSQDKERARVAAYEVAMKAELIKLLR
ncbi:hypothetical protein LTR37_004896 [Vermiconidia calcicola]|uniref:Uncharacterized protein n=1 Tax=Vermiconidia calcicola TaxID=1690605 RepID=A0ACC3NL22_9PEZI|nr:hypothetical protein LTR37_004896 [Vermiconidia calcicola]